MGRRWLIQFGMVLAGLAVSGGVALADSASSTGTTTTTNSQSTIIDTQQSTTSTSIQSSSQTTITAPATTTDGSGTGTGSTGGTTAAPSGSSSGTTTSPQSGSPTNPSPNPTNNPPLTAATTCCATSTPPANPVGPPAAGPSGGNHGLRSGVPTPLFYSDPSSVLGGGLVLTSVVIPTPVTLATSLPLPKVPFIPAGSLAQLPLLLKLMPLPTDPVLPPPDFLVLVVAALIGGAVYGLKVDLWGQVGYATRLRLSGFLGAARSDVAAAFFSATPREMGFIAVCVT